MSSSSGRFSADYAKRAANCTRCKQKLEKPCLRLAKVVANHWSSDGGDSKQYFHAACLFDSFAKARATTAVIETPADIEGWAELTQSDKDDILARIATLSEARANKAQNATPAKKKAAGGTPTKAETATAAAAAQPTSILTALRAPVTNAAAASTTAVSEVETGARSVGAGASDSWHAFCLLCERLAADNRLTEKTNILRRFITHKNFDGDVYLLCKLLLPAIDQRVYNLKEKQLIKLFSQIFNCDADEMTDHFNQSGEISDTVVEFFDSAHDGEYQSTLTNQDVDTWLQELSTLTRENEQQKHLKKIVKRCSPLDLKYVVREIRKDMRINARAPILDALAPNAYEAFQVSHDLQDVVRRALAKRQKQSDDPLVPSPTKHLSVNIQLGTAVKPMLAEACKSVGQAMKRCPNGMFAEVKYDGERVQVHKHGDKFTYFSRSLKPVLDHKVQHLKEFIPKAFPGGGDLILDSEVLLIDTNTSKPLPFGTLGKHKKNEFTDANVCLFVFDCLLYQGKSLMDEPLHKRKEILHENMTPVPNRVLLSDHEIVKHGESSKLRAMIEEAIDEGLEGLVLKDRQGVYEPNKRHWLKVKKDYLEEGRMADTADLIVLGAYYGTGSKGGSMSVFLMGTYDKQRKTYCTVTKCGNGHDDATLDRINRQLQTEMSKISKDANRLPDWFDCHRSLVPDFVVKDPANAPVWEITGAEFSKSDVHTAAGISIRFPRVTRIRDDKSAKEATSVDELQVLVAKSKEKPNLDDDARDDVEKGAKNGKFKFFGANSPQKRAAPAASSTTRSSSSTEKSDDDSPPKRRKIVCRYGASCYQKGAAHREQFAHPGDPVEPVKPKETTPIGEDKALFEGAIVWVSQGLPDRDTLVRYLCLFGADIADDYSSANATHLVCAAADKTPVDASAKAEEVTAEWVLESIKQKKLLPKE